MTEPHPTLAELLQRLAEQGQLAADDLRRSESWMRDATIGARTPWYLQPFIFLGALLGAALITIGIAEGLELRWEGAQMLTMGGVYMVAALVLHFCRGNDFTDHLGLAFSIGGHVFLLLGVLRLTRHDHPEMVVFLTATALSASLYGLYRDFLHRFLSCLLVFVLAKFALPAEGLGDALHALVAAMVLLCAVLSMRDRQAAFARPLVFACGYGLPVILLPLGERGLWFEDPELPRWWISSVVLALGLLWALRFAAARLEVRAPVAAQAVAVLSVAGLCALGAPGIMAALFLIVLGYAAQHGPLVVAGLLALPAFVFKYYYNLELDFVAKSGVLAGSGVILLIVRAAFVRSSWYGCAAGGQGT